MYEKVAVVFLEENDTHNSSSAQSRKM